MTVFLSVVQFLCIVLIMVLEFNKKSPAVFLWATVFLMFGVMHMMSCIAGSNAYSDAVLNEAALFVIGFCVVYALVRILLLRGCIKRPYPFMEDGYLMELSGHVTRRENLVYFLALCLVVLVDIADKAVKLGGVGNISWGATRTIQTSYLNISQILSVAFLLLSGLLLYALMRRQYTYAAVIAAVLFLRVIISRNRVEVIPLFACLLGYYLIKRRHITIKMIVFCSICACLVIYVVYGLRAYRWYGTIDNFLATVTFQNFNERILEFFRNDSGELGLRQWFYFFIDGDNRFKNFGQGHSYLRVLLTFLPTRFSLGLKPEDFAQSMGMAIGMGAGGSMHPTLFGDVYANFGIWGIFMGAFWAGYASLTDKIMEYLKNDICLFFAYSLCAYAYVVEGRGAVYNGHVMMAYGLLILVVLYAIKRRVLYYVRK